MAIDPMQLQQAYAGQPGTDGINGYGGQFTPQGWGSFFRRALPVAVNVARQFIPQDATQAMLAQQYGQQQLDPQSLFNLPQFRYANLPMYVSQPPRQVLPFDAGPQQFAPQGWLGDLAGQFGGAAGGAIGNYFGNRQLGQQIGGTLGNIARQYSPFDATQEMLAAQYAQQQQFAPQGWLGDLAGQYGGAVGGAVGGWLGNRQLGQQIGGTLGNIAQQYSPFDATQAMLAAQYGQQVDPQSLAGGYDPYGGQLAPQGWGSFFRRALPIAVDVARQFIPQDATQAMLAQQYAQAQQQQLDPQGYWGNVIGKYAQPVGSIVGGIAGNQQLGSQIGAAVGGLGQYLPFDATQQMLAAQQQQLAQQQALAQQQYAQQLDPQGFFGSLAGKVLGGVGGRVVGGWLGNKQLGQQIGSIAGGVGGSFLPFQAGPTMQGGYGYGYGY